MAPWDRAEAPRGVLLWCATALVALAVASMSWPGRLAAQYDARGHAERGIDLASPRAPARSGFALDVGAFLLVPLSVGGAMQLEMPGQVFVRAGLGTLPDALGSAYASLGASLAGWDTETEGVVADALGGALFFETALGARIAGGLELSVGYALLWARARASMSGFGATIETSNHAIHPALGWRSVIGDAVFVRVEVGWIHTLGASATVMSDQAGLDPSALEAELATRLRDRGFSPTLSIGLGLHLE